MSNEKLPPGGGEPPQDENQIIAERRAKLGKLREQGQAFPNDFRRIDLAADLHAKHGAFSKEELAAAREALPVQMAEELAKIHAIPVTRVSFLPETRVEGRSKSSTR